MGLRPLRPTSIPSFPTSAATFAPVFLQLPLRHPLLLPLAFNPALVPLRPERKGKVPLRRGDRPLRSWIPSSILWCPLSRSTTGVVERERRAGAGVVGDRVLRDEADRIECSWMRSHPSRRDRARRTICHTSFARRKREGGRTFLLTSSRVLRRWGRLRRRVARLRIRRRRRREEGIFLRLIRLISIWDRCLLLLLLR